MSRPAWAEIDLNAFQHNLQVIRTLASTSQVIAVIKANGYGHGIIRTAKALPEADAFGVASIDEAIQLREAGIKQRIVLLEGVFDAAELKLVNEHQLDLVIHNQAQVALLTNLKSYKSEFSTDITLWLKIDTGMHRLGIAPQEVVTVFEQLQALHFVRSPIILMTHLANADEIDNPANDQQLACFNSAIKLLEQSVHTSTLVIEKSIANSAAIMTIAATHEHWVRPGIMLYGICPFNDKDICDTGLIPVMSVKSKLIDVRQINAGESVGYGAQWVCQQATRVGVVAFGYGDGYPRHAANGTPVYINNSKVSLIGRVSMDMITIDLSDQPQAKTGDEVELWGKNLPVEDVARSATTIAYELVCGITQRVKFVEK